MTDTTERTETTANTTWSAMLAGNRRFADGKMIHPAQTPDIRKDLEGGQHPDALVLSCADSRVAPEIVFDAGLGDIFSVRTAGQFVDAGTIASLEFAVRSLHPSLLVVLGHQHCAAVAGARKEYDELVARTAKETGKPAAEFEDDMDQIIDASEDPVFRFTGQSVWQAKMADLDSAEDCEQVHIAHTLEYIVTHSETIRDAIAREQLMMVGARYRMDNGLVEVLSF